MNKIISSLCAAGLISVSFTSHSAALDDTARSSSSASGSGSVDWTVMDTNGDGLISRDEFMSYQERSYDGLQKNSSGMYELDSETRASGSMGSGDTDSRLNSSGSGSTSGGSTGSSGSGSSGSSSGSGSIIK